MVVFHDQFPQAVFNDTSIFDGTAFAPTGLGVSHTIIVFVYGDRCVNSGFSKANLKNDLFRVILGQIKNDVVIVLQGWFRNIVLISLDLQPFVNGYALLGSTTFFIIYIHDRHSVQSAIILATRMLHVNMVRQTYFTLNVKHFYNLIIRIFETTANFVRYAALKTPTSGSAKLSSDSSQVLKCEHEFDAAAVRAGSRGS
ncbi:hypothetical protein MTBSS4_350028 [Magnetospirillum sp. SS-4]|nr:hypothetical protein MTBSS4_350028 [Magnetospirillum sp. SS-4]